jgi:glutamate racemase
MVDLSRNPIGIFDSGVGGLTVVRAVMERLPFESIFYFGDTARVPYGIKSAGTICQYASQITEYLLRQNVKLLIVACNTMAAVARQVIEDLSSVPVLEVIDAGGRGAVKATRKKSVGVIGTLATVNSNAYARAIHRHDPDVKIYSQACPLFVPLVEEGWLSHPVTRMTAEEYLAPVLARDIDALVLGCTHYPLLKPLLQEVAGRSVQLVDSAETMAELAAEVLKSKGLENSDPKTPEYRFFVTDVPLRFQSIGERFLGRSLNNVHMVKW